MEPQSTQRNTPCSSKESPLKEITSQIISCAIEVHSILGPGLLENIYENALAHEFHMRGIADERQREINVRYKDKCKRTQREKHKKNLQLADY